MTQASARLARWGLVASAAATVCALSCSGALAAAAPGALKTVTYLGYSFAVPASWPVIPVTSTTCVRFDRHAIYLGAPGQDQDCPAGLLGTTEAVLVQPAAGQVPAASAADDQAARWITVVSPRIEVTATYGTDPGLVTQILASASLPAAAASTGAPGQAAPSGATENGATRNAALRLAAPAAAAADVPASATSYTGDGFDACAAPSAAYMSSWMNSSPYGAVGIYIGGAERACAQPNLTAGWVAQQAAAGWRFLPIYVGVQAEFGQITAPASQGVAAAQDAATQAAALGFGPGTPVYYDMEAYPASQESKALAFLSAWTSELHAEGYKSGVYSSSDSGVADLVANFTKYAMPDVIWDALWNGQANTTDPVIPAADWADGLRAHQFSGGADETYGGDTIDVDQDYLDVSLTPPGPVNPGSRALLTSGGTAADYVVRSRNLYTYYQTSPGGGFKGPKKLTSAGNLTGTPAVVQAANGIISVYSRTTGGAVRAVWQNAAGGAVTKTRNLGGHMAGSPAAIVTADDAIAVYAIGTNKQLYGYEQSRPGATLAGPSRLTSTGGLAGTPVAIPNANGTVSVYALTTGRAVRSKWQSTPDGPFRNSSSLGGHLSGDLAGVVFGDGGVSLYATGTSGHQYGDKDTAGSPFAGWAVL